MEVVNPQANFAFPTDKIREINRELRISLAKQAELECAEYNTIRNGKPPYRVALIEFADTPRLRQYGGMDMYDNRPTSNLRASAAYAQSAATPGAPGGGGVQEPDVEEGASDLGVQERFWVAAQVTLRAQQPG